MNVAQPKRQLRLSFEPGGPVTGSSEEREFRSSLSSVVMLDGGRTLFLGGDETVRREPSIERLTLQPDGAFAGHQSLSLGEFVRLPDPTVDEGRVGEVDIEGLAVDGGYLWFTGSYCCNRKQPNKNKSVAAQIEQLAKVRRGGNRFLLGRIPLAESATGSNLAREHDGRSAARLTEDWLRELRSDPHLGPFFGMFDANDNLALPSKDNGFDVEGLAIGSRADGSTRLLLGLRGPVLRGFAIVLELSPVSSGPGSLALQNLPGSDSFYQKHFLDLGGLGIRDLEFDGDELWILAGPTMVLDGPVVLYCWRPPFAASTSTDTLTRYEEGNVELRRELTLPFGESNDHAEGFAFLRDGTAPREFVLVYDSPARERRDEPSGVRADVFAVD